MSMTIPNVYHLRTVAEASSKACYVCYKPSTKVMITPDNKVRSSFSLAPSPVSWSPVAGAVPTISARTSSTFVSLISAIKGLPRLS